MTTVLKHPPPNGLESSGRPEEQQQLKINDVKKLLGSLPEKLSGFCSDEAILRYLRARNWHVKKAAKMLKETLKWRVQYKPESILWEEISQEAETGKIYRSTSVDKHGRVVLVMRPSCENSKSTKGKIRYLVYCMENAIQNLPADQEKIVWLIDFHGYNLANVSLKVTQETAHVLQEHYPERLGLAILYNPPKFFEPFWKMARPFLDPKTRDKVKFVYSDDANTRKILEEIFDMDELESAFGGHSESGFNLEKYAQRMREDDEKRLELLAGGPPGSQTDAASASLDSLSLISGSEDVSDSEKDGSTKLTVVDSEDASEDENPPVSDGCKKLTSEGVQADIPKA